MILASRLGILPRFLNSLNYHNDYLGIPTVKVVWHEQVIEQIQVEK